MPNAFLHFFPLDSLGIGLVGFHRSDRKWHREEARFENVKLTASLCHQFVEETVVNTADRGRHRVGKYLVKKCYPKADGARVIEG